MTASPTNASASPSAGPSGPVADAAQKPAPRLTREESIRDTIEAVAIAFILAFIFKTFEAEAFVIPTGSMAPTLYGRHKEVQCECCGLQYTIGASQEVDQDSGQLLQRITTSHCPNCRFRNDVFTAPVFNGDRIVVNKQVSEFQRFDVVVFKNPEEPHINYIKRLVGLPGETVQIRQGDIYTRSSAEQPWVIQRKQDLSKQQEVQQIVYDDSLPPALLLQAGAEERWVPSVPNPTARDIAGWPASPNAWQPADATRTYKVTAAAGEQHWLRYRHLIPSWEHWKAVEENAKIESPLQPQLVTDFCGFNPETPNYPDQEMFWTNDLTLALQLQIDQLQADAALTLELEEGARTVQCRLQPATGSVQLVALTHQTDSQNPPTETILATGTCPISGTGSWQLMFASVDDRLTLWVDGTPVALEQQAELATEGLNLPTIRDLAPAGISATGITASVSALKISRDLYYRADTVVTEPENAMTPDPLDRSAFGDFMAITVSEVGNPGYDWRGLLRTPAVYASRYAAARQELQNRYGDRLDFKLADDEYLMLGDNSPASKDSRLFDYYSRPLRSVTSNRFAVRRQDLIGEAMLIFWPHAVPFLNGGRGFSVLAHQSGDKSLKADEYPLYSFPFYPNISRMKLIR
jgi:signal peptidase I